MASTGDAAYSIAPDELDAIVTDLERGEASLDRLIEDLERDMRAFHDGWKGLSAAAHREALDEWRRGMSAMRAALAALRASAARAHGNYTKVVADNYALWRDLA